MSGDALDPQPPTGPGHPRLRRRAIVFYLLALLTILLLFAGILGSQHHSDLEAGRERAVARADIIAEWVGTTFAVSEYALGGLAQLLDDPLPPMVTGPAFEADNLAALLAGQRDRLAFIDELSLVDASGRIIASSAPWWPPGYDVGGQPFTRAFHDDPDLDVLVTPLYWSPNGQTYHLVHARRLRDPEGRFAGLAALRLDPAIFGEALGRLNMTRGESIALLDTDMQLVTRLPSFAGGGAMEVLGQPVVEPLTQAFIDGGEPQATLRTPSPLDGLERLYAMQRVGELPLVVVVGEEVGVILVGWWQRFWLLAGLFLLVMGLGGWLLRHYLNRLVLERELQGRLRELEEARRALQDREAQLRIAATAFQTHLGMLITDAAGAILRVNDTFSRITGYAEAEVVGQNPSLLSSGLHDQAFYATLWARVARDGSWQGEIWNRRKSGEVYPEWLTISAVRDAVGELTHYVATFSDLTERKAAEHEIHQLAFYDPLTGLPNRRLLLDRLEGTLKDSVRTGQFGALMFLDLDHFKRVNDTLGHHAGDQLLQRIAERLGEVLRETDTLARLGGDEFALLLHDLGHEADAVARMVERVANKLLGVLEAPIRLGDERLLVTASLGITLFRDHEATLDEILQQADMALFQAKSAGRNALSFFDPDMQRQLLARARLEGDLRQALPRGELRLHYQVQVGGNGTVNGVEGLLRWQHPERGMVSPDTFIPLAEENRLIVPIGHWVLETACRQLAAWAADPRTARLKISVNVSPRQFRETDFVERVLEILETTGAPACRLTLEVTESLFVEERDAARDKMLRLRERGITFALDDFGTGYSSLAYLKRLPLDQLKVDQSFVRDLLEDEISMAIVASTIALSHSLKLEVLAEGVETEAQRTWLAEHGCQSFQGYLFGRPVPVEALVLDG
ncbi:EAL domain-containing protein [Halomonas sp. HK25]|uniref:bifunctional diguanylate cyclase/phosphodiesterase n=1 Tax=Halomonas sp. HK25 TaxID=3394321 RepID=UPI0039FCDD17